MSIIARAKLELEAVNFGDEDSAVMVEILERFFDQWDSGGAVAVASQVLARLIAGQPLGPLTGNDDEWVEVGTHEGGPFFQNRRCSSVFKQLRDGVMVAHDIDVAGRPPIAFPYRPDRAEVRMPVVEIG